MSKPTNKFANISSKIINVLIFYTKNSVWIRFYFMQIRVRIQLGSGSR
jgi:hypothetical protein